MEPVAQLLLLEVLLREVLQVALAEGGVSGNQDLRLVARDGDGGAEVAGLPADLDAVRQEGLLREGGSSGRVMGESWRLTGGRVEAAAARSRRRGGRGAW